MTLDPCQWLRSLRKRNDEEVCHDGGVFCPHSTQLSSSLLCPPVLAHEKLFLEDLPSCDQYERSYMHRDTISHVVVTPTDFIITASVDGHLKFWKKHEERGIEFVKHFRSHLGSITSLSASADGLHLCTTSNDQAMKVYDIINFGK